MSTISQSDSATDDSQASSDVIVLSADELGMWDWITAGLILVGGIIIATMVARVVKRAIRSSATDAPANLIARVTSGVIIAVALLYALGRVGVRIGPLLGFLGVTGIALAFALQDILENFISGVLIQLNSPFRIGDQVRTNSVEGTVEDITMRTVVVRTYDGRRQIVPSAKVIKNVIDNDTAHQQRRTEIPVGVAYSASIPEARTLIEHAALQAPAVSSSPAPKAFVTELGASAILFSLHIWHHSSRSAQWTAVDSAIEHVKVALDTSGIGIPFDQLTLHLASPDSDVGAPEPTS